MKFEATYEDWEDEVTEHFHVDAKNCIQAFRNAWEYIHSLKYGGSLEVLYDEKGKPYYSECIEHYGAESKRLFLLSGPSGIGKTPLRKALESRLKLNRAILYTSRQPRNGEKDGIDYHFRSKEEISVFQGNPRFIVGKVRDMLQAIDLRNLDFSDNNLVYVEAHHTLGRQLRDSADLPSDVIPISVFMSPLSEQEIKGIPRKHLEQRITELIRDKLVLREGADNIRKLSSKKQREIIVKSKDAYSELKNAYLYDYVLVNHDGEGHPNWGAVDDVIDYVNTDAERAIYIAERLARYAIFRPHISIREFEGRLITDEYPLRTNDFLTKGIEHWTKETIY